VSAGLPRLPATFAASRDALHRLAVYVISPAQRLANGEIVLRPAPGGFSTFEFAGGRVVGIDGGDLVVDAVRVPVTTLRAAAAAVGIEPDLVQEEEFDVPPAGDLDGLLEIDSDGAGALGAWYAFAAGALEGLRAAAAPGDDASPVRIWPEHFDAAFDMGDEAGGTRTTYGASPGDRRHDRPYLYASPWAGRVDGFFDDPGFRGAALTYDGLAAAPDPPAAAAAFLGEARRRIAGAAP
jgi:hypothetical protein